MSESEKPIGIFWPCFLTIISDIALAAVIVIIIGKAIPGDFDYSLGTFIVMALQTRGGATDMRINMWIRKMLREKNLDGESRQ